MTDHGSSKTVRAGKIKEELKEHRESHSHKGFGALGRCDYDIFGKLSPHDIVLLCSDGIHALLTDDEIQSILLESGESKTACEWLIQGLVTRRD